MMNLQESIRRVLKEELKTKFFLRRVTPEEVARYFSSFDGQVFFETEIYEEFKYQLVLNMNKLDVKQSRKFEKLKSISNENNNYHTNKLKNQKMSLNTINMR